MVKRGTRVFWGIFFLTAAVLVVLHALGILLGVGILLLFTAELLVFWALRSMYKRHLIAGLMLLALCYLLVQGPLGLLHIPAWVLLLSTALAGAGIGLIWTAAMAANFRVRHGYWGWWHQDRYWVGEEAEIQSRYGIRFTHDGETQPRI